MRAKIKQITSEDTHEIRHQILRPNQTLDDCHYRNDNAESTIHFGAYQRDQLVGIASLYHETLPDQYAINTWRLRGMAIREPVQQTGIFNERLVLSM